MMDTSNRRLDKLSVVKSRRARAQARKDTERSCCQGACAPHRPSLSMSMPDAQAALLHHPLCPPAEWLQLLLAPAVLHQPRADGRGQSTPGTPQLSHAGAGRATVAPGDSTQASTGGQADTSSQSVSVWKVRISSTIITYASTQHFSHNRVPM